MPATWLLIALCAVAIAAPVTAELPVGNAPLPVATPQFPDRLHAFVWRNWSLVPLDRMAATVEATPDQIREIGMAMGLGSPPRISADLQRRSGITVLRRNWHLLPYEQILTLLDWTPAQLEYSLREDDFLYIKLGSLKPRCAPVRYEPPTPAAHERERQIAAIAHRYFPDGVCTAAEPLFAFVRQLSSPMRDTHPQPAPPEDAPLRLCYSYFALYGDPLMDTGIDPYPDGYLDRLAREGVNAVWLQAVLYRLAPFPWETSLSEGYETRLKNLAALASRTHRHGIRLYLYLNEPRAMPAAFFNRHPELRGVAEGDHCALCTSVPAVQEVIASSIATICRAAPELGGFFTITASENLTNCWSHGQGDGCPRCGPRGAPAVIAELLQRYEDGIRRAHGKQQLIAWDWGWQDAWAEPLIGALPREAALMSVSEWDLPLQRGGVESRVGEYSISAVGPGPRAEAHWALARKRGLRTIAKIQANNSWELSAVPYIPALDLVARHALALRQAGVQDIMLGWTLGGWPSPNMEALRAAGAEGASDADSLLLPVARQRFGAKAAPEVVKAWRRISAAFEEFPYNGGVLYTAPLQVGPSNPLWERPTGYQATMVGFPYDDTDSWHGPYPIEVFAAQLERVAAGFQEGADDLRHAGPSRALSEEADVAEAAGIHFRSVANQTRFIVARRALDAASNAAVAQAEISTLERLLNDEIALASRLHTLQCHDSRLGFEASNQYYYVPADLAEKVLICRDLLDRWLPEQSRHYRH